MYLLIKHHKKEVVQVLESEIWLMHQMKLGAKVLKFDPYLGRYQVLLPSGAWTECPHYQEPRDATSADEVRAHNCRDGGG